MFRSSLAPKAFGAGGTDISILHHFPALRTGLLSLSPSGTSLQRILPNLMLTRMGGCRTAAGRSREAPPDRFAGIRFSETRYF